ncbi:PaaI family thioesterase [Oceanithermus sp.]
MRIAIQDTYPDDVAHCYGCSRLNPHGYQLKTYPAGEQTESRFTPELYHTAVPGFVYGGLIASLIDCHSTGSAAIFKMQAEGKEPGSEEAPRFVTARLEVDFLAPTPLGVELRLVGRAVEVKERKVVVETDLYAGQKVTARGRAVLVLMPQTMAAK